MPDLNTSNHTIIQFSASRTPWRVYRNRCPVASFDLGRQVSNKLLFHCNLSHTLIKALFVIFTSCQILKVTRDSIHEDSYEDLFKELSKYRLIILRLEL
ncbi:uncharacterized protein LOC133745442 isoform X2 [Rosa rugosa]|uniref:uncharacterized protein LOC133745442 isoform X2 n=1 Tax=Rosa rugosa TaxID=74645 RepID=UPI002B40E5DB|nr:uncharacterized protein LOC133745442 isoform X2 [Rosa rugosa]